MRIFRRLTIVLVVVLALLVGLDVFARHRTESAIGEQIASRSKITPAPTVTIHGWSFLAQVVSQDVQHVSIVRNDLRVGRLTGVDVTVDLHHLQVPMRNLLGGDLSGVTARTADFAVRLDPAALADAIGLKQVTVSPAPDGGIRLATTVGAAGSTFPIEADVNLRITGSSLALSASRVNAGGLELPPQVSSSVLKALNVRLPLSGLPFAVPSASASVADGAVVLTASAANVPVGELVRASR